MVWWRGYCYSARSFGVGDALLLVMNDALLLRVTHSPLFLAFCTLWLLGLNVGLSSPATARQIVTCVLFVLLLIWMLLRVFG